MRFICHAYFAYLYLGRTFHLFHCFLGLFNDFLDPRTKIFIEFKKKHILMYVKSNYFCNFTADSRGLVPMCIIGRVRHHTAKDCPRRAM